MKKKEGATSAAGSGSAFAVPLSRRRAVKDEAGGNEAETGGDGRSVDWFHIIRIMSRPALITSGGNK